MKLLNIDKFTYSYQQIIYCFFFLQYLKFMKSLECQYIFYSNANNVTRIFSGSRGPSNLQLTCLKECYIPTPNALVCKQYGWPRYFRLWMWRWRPIIDADHNSTACPASWVSRFRLWGLRGRRNRARTSLEQILNRKIRKPKRQQTMSFLFRLNVGSIN